MEYLRKNGAKMVEDEARALGLNAHSFFQFFLSNSNCIDKSVYAVVLYPVGAMEPLVAKFYTYEEWEQYKGTIRA